jgi:hypothetical protein
VAGILKRSTNFIFLRLSSCSLTQLCTDILLLTATCRHCTQQPTVQHMEHAANTLRSPLILHNFILHPSFLGLTVSCVPFMRDNIKIDYKEMGFEYLDCIHMIQIRSSEHGNETSGP